MLKVSEMAVLLGLLLALVSAAAKISLIVVHDAGESNFIRPDVLLLQKDQTRPVRVFALGLPALELFSGDEFRNVLVTPESLGLDTVVIDGNDGREQILSESDMVKLFQTFPPNMIEIVVTGMVYKMESQIAGAYRRAGRRVVGIFDSFALWNENSICAKDFVDSEPPAIDEIWLCAKEQDTEELADHLERVVVTGSPTLTEWRRDASSKEKVRRTREILLKSVSRDPAPARDNSVIVVYAGGYGGITYNESVSTFCEACASADDDSLLCVFSPHPGYPPSFEAEIFESNHCVKEVLIVDDSFHLTTSAVVAASNASLSECSTVGGQSVAISIPHAYVNGPGDTCQDVFTSSGLIDNVTNAAALRQKILMAFKSEDYYISPARVEEAGVPLDGESRVLAAFYDGP